MTNLIGIVSDTHEDVRMIRKAVAIFKQRAPSLVIHCGDIILKTAVKEDENGAGAQKHKVF